MTIFHLTKWTADRGRLPELEQAIGRALEHVRHDHPSVLSARCWRVRYGDGSAMPQFVWQEEYAGLTAFEEGLQRETTPACAEIWQVIFACALPGTVTTSLWADYSRAGWFERGQ